ncbi:MAG: type II secretion system protein [Bacteroidales bacterium]|nr:type II secretion system protein [Bacteroidales bacterium]
MLKLKLLKGSTIIEVIVAMMLIMLCYGIITVIFLNIKKTGNNRLKLNAYLLIEHVIQETNKEKSFFDEDYEYDNLIIYKTVSKYQKSEDLKEICFEANNKDGNIIIEKKYIVLVK